MQYHIQTLVKHLFDKDSFEQVTVQELKQFTDDYPYAAVGQYLYAKKLKDSGSYNHYDQSGQASLYFHNALWLRWQLDNKEELPVLPVKAEEPAQQPGFRIVVQMPKTAPPIISTKPVPPTEEKKEAEPTTEVPATSETAAAATEPPVQADTDQTAAPVAEEAIAEEKENGLEVNEDGSLVEQETVTEEQPEQAPDAPPVPEEINTPAETASAVAIAEGSELAEESSQMEAAVNAVSITEEAFIPPVVPAEAAPETETIDKEIDDIIPAIEITPEEAAIPAVVEETAIPEETAPVEVVAGAPSTAPVEETAPPEIVAEQPVEAVTEINASEEAATISANATPAAAIDGENTTNTAPPADVPDKPVEGESEGDQGKPLVFKHINQEEKAAVDLGEPIFESYHTIDYFASQGIKLMQEELKDKLGKQLKSFTDWLRSMKRIGPIDPSTSIDEVTNQSIQRIAEHSVEEKEVLTEAMAEVWAKQGNADKAIRVYEKLSLLNPAKSTYFAGRIEQLKAQ